MSHPPIHLLPLTFATPHSSTFHLTPSLSPQPADIYLIDEPSAYLDSEQRLVAAKVIRR